jgi:hypothetical protein
MCRQHIGFTWIDVGWVLLRTGLARHVPHTQRPWVIQVPKLADIDKFRMHYALGYHKSATQLAKPNCKRRSVHNRDSLHAFGTSIVPVVDLLNYDLCGASGRPAGSIA